MIYTIMFPLDSWSSYKKKELLKIMTLLENSKIEKLGEYVKKDDIIYIFCLVINRTKEIDTTYEEAIYYIADEIEKLDQPNEQR